MHPIRSATRPLLRSSLLVLGLAAAVALAAPGAASAHDGEVHAAAPASLLQRAIAAQQRAIAALPAERAGRCETTRRLPGAGPACRTRDGLVRVGAPGSPYSFLTHGPDLAGALQEFEDAELLPATKARVDAASVSDIVCVETPGVRRIELVYVVPSGRAGGSRYAEIAPQLRQQVYKASAYLDAETAAKAPGTSRRMPIRCRNGVPTVANVTLPAGDPDLYAIAARLAERGYPVPFFRSTSTRRVFAYYDEANVTFGGIGMIWQDQVKGVDNLNNKGGRYAIQYGASTPEQEVNPIAIPNWKTVLHEEMHNMGAVQQDAPADNGGSHCNDGLDLMCYAEPTVAESRYTTTWCPQYGRLDCGGDTYFNPRPARDSYLDEFWNVGNSMNLWLVPSAPSPSGPDTRPPGAVGLFQTVPDDAGSILWVWDQAGDSRSYDMHYFVQLQVRTAAGWRLARPGFIHGDTELWSRGLSAGRSYRLAVLGVDDSGNRGPVRFSPPAVAGAAPDATAPPRPERVTLTSTSPGRLAVRWSRAVDGDSALAGYVVSLQRREAGRWREYGVRRTRGRATVFRGLEQRRSYRAVVRALDLPGNSSGMASSNTADADGVGPFVIVVA